MTQVIPFARLKRRTYAQAAWEQGLHSSEDLSQHIRRVWNSIACDLFRCGLGTVVVEWITERVATEAVQAERQRRHGGIAVVRRKLAVAGRWDLVTEIDKHFEDLLAKFTDAETPVVLPFAGPKPGDPPQTFSDRQPQKL